MKLLEWQQLGDRLVSTNRDFPRYVISFTIETKMGHLTEIKINDDMDDEYGDRYIKDGICCDRSLKPLKDYANNRYNNIKSPLELLLSKE